ncbi:hypothetical protein AGR4B_Lc60373 [Agrobacterium tumefaciens str. CFBP 5621]|nr:hypothetical protein AGR4B_Lc60373 [Agrobacterium tumefaciens str. CFBP 5621]
MERILVNLNTYSIFRIFFLCFTLD